MQENYLPIRKEKDCVLEKNSEKNLGHSVIPLVELMA